MKAHEIEVPTVANDKEKMPTYGSAGAAGADVRADTENPIDIPAGESACIPTGLFFDIPEGYEIQVRPRSGLAFKNQITVLNSPGTIDHDYRGELKVILINHGKTTFSVTPKMRIAQIIVSPVVRAQFLRCKELTSSERGQGGFGSTGTH